MIIVGDSEVHLLSQEEGSEDLVLERLTTNHNAADKSEGKNNGALSAILACPVQCHSLLTLARN
jgi:hypothetical protein